MTREEDTRARDHAALLRELAEDGDAACRAHVDGPPAMVAELRANWEREAATLRAAADRLEALEQLYEAVDTHAGPLPPAVVGALRALNALEGE